MKFDDFDRMMRQHELSLNETVPECDWVVLRLDGRGFTKLTKEALDFARPFDERFHAAMQKTCEHLMICGAKISLCYTQSDEISLLLKNEDTPFSGKTRKLNSVFAGEASGIFSLEVGRPVAFDCRAIPLAQTADVVDYFRWRGEDAKRNGLTAFCYWTLRAAGFEPAEVDVRMYGLSKDQKLELLSEYDVDFAAQPQWMRTGSFLRWRSDVRVGLDPRTKRQAPTTRQVLEWLAPGPEGQLISNLVVDVCSPES
ncbi:MAG: guanylyltransferase [Rhizobiaceae bacterium MnEN-MB40S]|nr:MAG: guanylyltransferase [Rhizobiaceae bacterium MnEN-MB40S]